MSNRITLLDDGSVDAHTIRLMLAHKRYENLHIADVAHGAGYSMVHNSIILSSLIPILEYIDEIVPSPPLQPVYPAARAIHRAMLVDAYTHGIDRQDILRITRSTTYLHSPTITTLDLYALAVASQVEDLQRTPWYQHMISARQTALADCTDGALYATR